MKRYAIYERVSTDEQARPGHVSLETQSAALRDRVRKAGGALIAEIEDVESSTGDKGPSRPGYQKLLSLARRGEIDVVVVYDWSRWGRNAGESITSYGELSRLGVVCESLFEPGDDPFVQGIHALRHEAFARDLSKKTRDALFTRARKGEWSGAPPVGYTVHREKGVSRLRPDDRAPAVARLFAEAASGACSLAQLADMAKTWGLRGRSDHVLSRQAIGKILRNPTYRGAVVYGRGYNGKFARRGPRPVDEWIVVEDAHTAIVDRETFDAVQQVLTRHRTEQGTVRRTKHLLTSLVFCARCEGVTGPAGEARSWRMYGHGSVKGRYYECSRRAMYGECGLPIIAAVGFEEVVKAEATRRFTIPDDYRVDAAEYIRGEVEAQRSAGDHQRRHLVRELEKHQTNRSELARRRLGMAGDVIPEDVYRRLEQEEARAVKMLEREIASLPVEPEADAVYALMDVLDTVTWQDFDADDWRRLLALLVERIEVHDRGDYEIIWQPSAEILGRAVAQSVALGSRSNSGASVT